MDFRIPVVIFFACTLGYSSAAAKDNDIVVVPQNETLTKRDGSTSSSLVYGCVAGNQTGPCVDSKELCTSQSGQFVGYCFFEQQYKGVCCVGLDPATATLTTTAHPATIPSLNDSPEPPAAPTIPPITLPSIPSLPSLPATPAVPTVPPIPSLPSLPATPALPTVPPIPATPAPPSLPSTPAIPTLPSLPDTPAPPTLPATPAVPTVPPIPSLPSLPATPALPTVPPVPATPAPPSLPSTPATPTLPSLPTLPPLPDTPAPPSLPSTPATPTLPSLPTLPPLPDTPATPTLPATPAVPTVPSIPSPPSLPPTPATPSLPPIPPLPSLPSAPTIPQLPSAEPSAAHDSEASDEVTPATDLSCSQISTEVQSTFSNPSYPSLDTKPNVYQYTVVPQSKYCALRLEFIEALFAGRNMDSCSIDSVVIINSGDSLSVPQCGLLQGYRYTVRTISDQPVRVVITTQGSAYLWSMNVTQVKCSSIRPYQDYESRGCGARNVKPSTSAGVIVPSEKESIKVVSASRLLKSKKRTLAEITIGPLGPSKLLQSAALNRKTEIKIVRGNETGVNEWPWQVLLMINGRPLCGGSLINDEWVITAAHCVQFSLRYPLTSVLTVDLGDHDLKTVTETRNVVVRVSQIVPNVKYEAVHNDIALIKLATKVPLSKTIKPVCLPYPKNPVSTYEGETGITTGWGRTEDSVISPALREANVKIISNEECRQDWSSIGEGGGNLIDNGMICAGGGDIGPCNGDSGGPLVIQEYNKWRLIGLTSFGSLRGCAISGIPTVFTRVSSFADWIALNIAE